MRLWNVQPEMIDVEFLPGFDAPCLYRFSAVWSCISFLLLGGFGFDNCLPSLCTVCPEVEGLQVVLCIETSVASHVILVYPAIMVPQWQCL